MDSQGRKVVVCDNGTGVSWSKGQISVFRRSRLIGKEGKWKQEVANVRYWVGRARNVSVSWIQLIHLLRLYFDIHWEM